MFYEVRTRKLTVTSHDVCKGSVVCTEWPLVAVWWKQHNVLVLTLGPLDPWPFGPMALWTHGSLDPWHVIISDCLSLCLFIRTFHQCNISSKLWWRKVVCYPIMSLSVYRSLSYGSDQDPLGVDENVENIWNFLKDIQDNISSKYK